MEDNELQAKIDCLECSWETFQQEIANIENAHEEYNKKQVYPGQLSFTDKQRIKDIEQKQEKISEEIDILVKQKTNVHAGIPGKIFSGAE